MQRRKSLNLNLPTRSLKVGGMTPHIPSYTPAYSTESIVIIVYMLVIRK